MDPLSVERIKLLHPKLRVDAMQILAEITEKVNTPASYCRYAFTLRTMAEQQALYDQGRTKPGKVVTNAKPGQSLHNYGLAIDIAFIIDHKTASWNTKADWNANKTADWMEVVAIFKRHGWVWGGDFKSILDMPHFEKTFGYTWRQLLQLKNAGKVDRNGYVLI